MKYKSREFPQVIFEEWITPIQNKKKFWLVNIVKSKLETHFIFQTGNNRTTKYNTHVLSIGNFSPFRVTEEAIAYHVNRKLFTYGKKSFKSTLFGCRTWKLWNTPYVLEMETKANVISGYTDQRDKSICEYFITTEDEDIEFITLMQDDFVWHSHPQTDLKKLTFTYMEYEKNQKKLEKFLWRPKKIKTAFSF